KAPAKHNRANCTTAPEIAGTAIVPSQEMENYTGIVPYVYCKIRKLKRRHGFQRLGDYLDEPPTGSSMAEGNSCDRCEYRFWISGDAGDH
ncbi:hypothetical protein CRG98_045790, partial [Punica granatum]